MSEILRDLSVTARAVANQQNFLALIHPLVDADPDFHFQDNGELLFCHHARIAHPYLNAVVQTRLSQSPLEDAIARCVRHYRVQKHPWLWMVWPADQPSGLSDRLETNGFQCVEQGALMSLDLTRMPPRPPLPAGLTIERVTDRATLNVCNEIIARVFEMPFEFADCLALINDRLGFGAACPLQFYIGVMDGEPVAVSSVVYGAGVAGVYNVSTLPGHRGRGIGAAMTLAPQYDALARGYQWAVLQASAMGEPIYARLGYQVDGHRRLYALPAPAST